MANITKEKKAIYTGQNAKQHFKANELKKSSSTVSKVLNEQFKKCKEPNKLYKFHKEGYSVENVVTTRESFSYAKFIEAHPELEAKAKKFFTTQTVQTVQVKELKAK